MKGSLQILFFISGCCSSFASQSTSYSWRSTIWELQNLTGQDGNMVHDLESQLNEGKLAINAVLAQVNAVKESVRNYRELFKRDPNDRELLIVHKAQLDKKMGQLSNASIPFSNDVANGYLRNIQYFPKWDDMKIVMRSLLDASHTHGLKAHDLARGYIFGDRVGAPMSSYACYSMAATACQSYKWSQCLEWCEEAMNRVNDTDAHYSTDDVEELKESRLNNDEYDRLCESSLNGTYIENWSNAGLKCALWDNRRHPRLVLRPVRVEQISRNPSVMLFHDVISDQQITFLKNRCLPRLKRATTAGEIKSDFDIDNHRVAHNCWVKDWNETVVRGLEGLIEAATGTVVRQSSENLQIANYGIGGHYYTHLDATSQRIHPTHGGREATFMYYLSDVAIGGATAFVHLGVAVKPQKGAAIFWYNFLSDSETIDLRSKHGACPVVLGDKWVANKWIQQTPRSICRTK